MYLDVSSMPHMLRSLILMILFFTEPFYLVYKPRDVLNSIFQCKSSKPHKQLKQQCSIIMGPKSYNWLALSISHSDSQEVLL